MYLSYKDDMSMFQIPPKTEEKITYTGIKSQLSSLHKSQFLSVFLSRKNNTVDLDLSF